MEQQQQQRLGERGAGGNECLWDEAGEDRGGWGRGGEGGMMGRGGREWRRQGWGFSFVFLWREAAEGTWRAGQGGGCLRWVGCAFRKKKKKRRS